MNYLYIVISIYIAAITAATQTYIKFENTYFHDIIYDSFNITNNGQLDKGIVNIEGNCNVNINNSRFYGCPKDNECKNYNLYIDSGEDININNTEFKDAAGGMYIYNVHKCNIMNSIFRDHDMALNDKETSKYKEYGHNPGAMYGGAIYVSNAREFSVENTLFKNNAVNEQGGAIYMSLYFEYPLVNFKNVTLENNFSYSEGRDIFGI
ncbi:hypothetical protein BCR36DRAFT_308464 [Piromyces finnis]|uniref:Right handed beta helix domain-containing protein n=1 Tax=Piromyces finnis TaxID=1754191 RepID=A0A1Y1UWW2_9FUNG|nr:hypothetical protein BCR36DRAFT_308464 [Piromyces finnis]|eukprot:ORX42123.1 hypothetical protein BCR36DRAFT_308464 [Piromyces finnis]